MNKELLKIWEDIRRKSKCNQCPLKSKKPLIFPIEENKKCVVVTEGPNREESNTFIASIAKHPTFTFLYALFKGNFKPTEPNATVYWAHVRKCFLNGVKKSDEETALNICKTSF